jgi:hypothetical protein
MIAPGISVYPLAIRVTALTVFALLLCLVLWRRRR